MEISIVVRKWDRTRKADVKIDDEVTIRELLANAIKNWKLPPPGAENEYVIIHNHNELSDTNKTISQSGIKDGDTVDIGIRIVPGSIIRLKKEYERLFEFEKNSNGKFKIISTNNDPPTEYIVRFYCKGVASIDRSGNPILSEEHEVEITLKANHPLEIPIFKFLTPTFHPNVYDSNKICTGENWAPNKWLSNYCQMIFDLLSYNPNYLALNDAANSRARDWAKKNMHLFPFSGDGHFINEPKSTKTIDWIDR